MGQRQFSTLVNDLLCSILFLFGSVLLYAIHAIVLLILYSIISVLFKIPSLPFLRVFAYMNNEMLFPKVPVGNKSNINHKNCHNSIFLSYI